MYIRNWNSKFFELTVVSLNSQILKAPPTGKLCLSYKAFHKNSFNNDLKSKLDEKPRLFFF